MIVGVCITSVITVSLFGVTHSLRVAQDLLVLDALMSGTKMEYGSGDAQSEISDDQTSVENGFLNEYHRMASDLDITKLEEMLSETPVQIPEEYYNLSLDSSGKKDYLGEIEIYKLICEILTRPEIREDGSFFKLQPYHIYGSWFNESRMIRSSASSTFDPYKSLITITNSYGYRGPFQMSPAYQDESCIGPYDARMYGFVSTGENSEVDSINRVLRIQNSELFGSITSNAGIVATTYERPAELDKYVEEFKSNIRFDKYRPNPEYLPDAMYTFVRKLKTASKGVDVATLNPNDNYIESLSNLDSVYSSSVTNKTDENLTDLYYLFALQLNSGFVQIHQWNPSISIDAVHNYRGLMPAVYVSMLKKYDTLNIADLDYFNGWTARGSLVEHLCGKPKGKGPFSSLKVSEPNNLISALGYRDIYDKALSNLPTEYNYTSIYGLEAIANGSMIERGVEYMIKAVYEWQQSKGYLKSQQSIDNEFDLDGGSITAPGTSSHSVTLQKDIKISNLLLRQMMAAGSPMALPFSYSNSISYTVTHDFYCNGNYYCLYHPRYSHYGIDMIYASGGSQVMCSVNAIMDGTIVEVRKATNGKDNPWGNTVKIRHTIGAYTYTSRYGHMSSMVFSPSDVGRTIKCGDYIGTEGTTGRSTGNHLHFGLARVLNNSVEKAMDPLQFIETLDKEIAESNEG